MFDYQAVKDWPCFHVDFTLYPNENQQVESLVVLRFLFNVRCLDQFSHILCRCFAC